MYIISIEFLIYIYKFDVALIAEINSEIATEKKSFWFKWDKNGEKKMFLINRIWYYSMQMEIELHANLTNDNRSDNDTVSETKPKDQELMRFLS